jgi:virginiamycin B lyase
MPLNAYLLIFLTVTALPAVHGSVQRRLPAGTFTVPEAGQLSAPKRPGVKDPSVRIPMDRLKPDHVFDIPGVPDWIAIDEHVWVSNYPKNSVTRIDPKTNTIVATIGVGKSPCSGLAAGFGSLWVPNCDDPSVSRVDLKTGNVSATLPLTIGDSEGGLATGAGSVWMMVDKKGTLVRIDPATNKVVAEIYVAPGSFAVAFADNVVWVTSTDENLVTRVNASTNVIEETITVGARPRFLAVGAESVWTINQGDGTISRVDVKTNKVVATIEAGIPGNGGEIAVGEGSVWITSFEYPITRIDPTTNKVVQQFYGPGGDAIRVGHGSVWLSNLRQSNVWRLDPKRIEATQQGPGARGRGPEVPGLFHHTAQSGRSSHEYARSRHRSANLKSGRG